MEAAPSALQSCAGPPGSGSLAARGMEAQGLAERFHALADATRLRVLHLLHTRGELCACEIQNVLGTGASNLSAHLRVLRLAGFIVSRREGKRVFFRLAPAQPQSFMQTIEGLFAVEPGPSDR